jgi:hypothetical protein
LLRQCDAVIRNECCTLFGWCLSAKRKHGPIVEVNHKQNGHKKGEKMTERIGKKELQGDERRTCPHTMPLRALSTAPIGGF